MAHLFAGFGCTRTWQQQNTCLMVIFQCYQSGRDSIGAKDDGAGRDNWSCKRCTVSVKSSPPTNQHLVFTGRMPFLSPNQHCQSTENPWTCSTQVHLRSSVLFLTTNGSWLHGTVAKPSHASTLVYDYISVEIFQLSIVLLLNINELMKLAVVVQRWRRYCCQNWPSWRSSGLGSSGLVVSLV